MDYRRLGDSGLKVSEIGLGCNNFGMRIDQAATNAVIDAAIEHGVTFFDTADVYGGRGKSEEMMGVALKGKRDKVVLATKFASPDGRWARQARRLAALHHGGGRGQPEAAADRLHRPLPDAPARPGHADRGDAERPRRPRDPGQGPLHRQLQLHRLDDRRRRLDVEERAHEPLRLGAEQLLAAGAPRGARGDAGLRAVRPRHAALLPARLGHADRQVQARRGAGRRHPDGGLGRAGAGRRSATRTSTRSRRWKAGRPSAATRCWSWRSPGCWATRWSPR